ncbi:MAG TPA: hypothetical protein ENO09_00385 [bacterium]|nr:MAG: hypothetical protein B7Y40_03550 [Gammaproteobacteria bacterium 28-57-27]HES75442.1 hypothetical protein [bacterium]
MNTSIVNITDEALHLPVEARIALADKLLESLKPSLQQNTNDEYETVFRHRVFAGIASAEVGRVVAAEDVEHEFAQRRAETMRRLTSNQ